MHNARCSKTFRCETPSGAGRVTDTSQLGAAINHAHVNHVVTSDCTVYCILYCTVLGRRVSTDYSTVCDDRRAQA